VEYSKIDYFKGMARFVGQKEIEILGTKENISADHVIIAAGSKSSMGGPDF
jgi:pyruvate/2-oxoglutarate dehydrogenase complex dihydrolipoamide dehydrogenase (E3) component